MKCWHGHWLKVLHRITICVNGILSSCNSKWGFQNSCVRCDGNLLLLTYILFMLSVIYWINQIPLNSSGGQMHKQWVQQKTRVCLLSIITSHILQTMCTYSFRVNEAWKNEVENKTIPLEKYDSNVFWFHIIIFYVFSYILMFSFLMY